MGLDCTLPDDFPAGAPAAPLARIESHGYNQTAEEVGKGASGIFSLHHSL